MQHPKQVVYYQYGKESAEKLEEAGVPLEFKTYSNMGASPPPNPIFSTLLIHNNNIKAFAFLKYKSD
jgi:hypothetical protein